MSKDEVRAGGAVGPTDATAVDAVVALVARHLGAADHVFRDLESEPIPIDVHVVRPADADDAWTLFTTGMSDRPMQVPDGVDAPRSVELMVRLPATWPVLGELRPGEPAPREVAVEARWHWPVRWLKHLARLPHTLQTWLGDGHTIPNGDPPQAVAPGVPFVGFVIGAPASLPEDDDVARPGDGNAIHLFAIYPLHPDELVFKLARGWGELADRLADAGVDDVIDLARPSVAKLVAAPARRTSGKKRR